MIPWKDTVAPKVVHVVDVDLAIMNLDNVSVTLAFTVIVANQWLSLHKSFANTPYFLCVPRKCSVEIYTTQYTFTSNINKILYKKW